MADDKVDLSPLVNEQLALLQNEPLPTAIEALHVLERRTRIAKDDSANCLVCTAIVNLCISHSNWTDLGTNIAVLAKRRGYSRRSVSAIVEIAMAALDQIADTDTRITLVRVLLEITEGKIFVEIARARLTEILVNHLESRGELMAALNLLQDLRLEILTTMAEPERIGLMLHQFRLCLDAKDQLRASLCAEKITDQRVQDPGLRLEFLNLLVHYHSNFTRDFAAIGQSWYSIFQLNQDGNALVNAIVNAVLAPHSEQQVKFCQQLQQLKELTLLPDAKNMLCVFLGRDLVPWAEFEPRFTGLIPNGETELMRQRVIEHSLRVVALYYTNIRLQRLAELEQITVDELEDRIVDLVFNEGFYAKIDRPKGIITFKRKLKVPEVADEFSGNVMKLCRLVDQAHMLVEKERMCVHRPKV
jgi:hypothetical protein